MIRSTSRAAAAAVAILGLAAGATTLATTAASAQTTMPGGQAIPPPPSANDPPPRTVTPAKKTRAAKPATATSRESQGSYTDRIDTRPARGDIQLEDDPRVRPTMENGRPGVGMRF